MKIKIDNLYAVVWVNLFNNTPNVYPKLYTSYDEAKKCVEELGSDDFVIKRVFI
jgi:hypothetical protein